MHRLAAGFLFLILSITSLAQNLEPKGYFLADSVKIGEEFGYSLSLEYPSELNVLFPDSTYTYKGFDLERKESFPTKTTGDTSRDSAVYYFTTFEIDSIQFLSLPVYLLTKEDSVIFEPEKDSFILAHVVTQIPDSLALIDNTIYRPVRYQFNYPYLLIGLGVLVVIVVVVWILFGKRIRKRYQGYLVKKRHRKFIERFDSMSKNGDPEPTLTYWKKYMEQLEAVPFTKMTTKEILRKTSKESLENPLRSIDRVIYAQFSDSELANSWGNLKEYSNDRYMEKINQLQNA